MKPLPWGKNEKDASYCEINCAGYEYHTGRCVGWALFGDGYPRDKGNACLKSEDAFEICLKNKCRG